MGNSIFRLLGLIFWLSLATCAFRASAGYSNYLYVQKVSPKNYEAIVTIEDVDWDDPKSLICVQYIGDRQCIVKLGVQLNSAYAYFELKQTYGVSQNMLREANIRNVGGYFKLLRELGKSPIGTYTVPITFPSDPAVLYNYHLCIILEIYPTGESVDCSYSGQIVYPSCDIWESQISLDHGSLSAARVNGHIATGDLTISCSAKTAVKLVSPRPNPRLPLTADGSLYSTIYVGDKPLSEGLLVDAGAEGTRVRLTSTLGTVGTPQTGQFSGSVVIVAAQP
ncbi:hypothetical protein R3D73_003740 [Serratia marcescens]|nr:hypothetical protein [Serratia marcescens]ELQ9440554.1 hypothetical protein [Serratia marcescens]ELT5561994.1 hypothetical protein [Serratia marcescens]